LQYNTIQYNQEDSERDEVQVGIGKVMEMLICNDEDTDGF